MPTNAAPKTLENGPTSLDHGQAEAQASQNLDGIRVRTGVQAGGWRLNHNGIRVRTGVRAGGFRLNHNVIAVRASVRAV